VLTTHFFLTRTLRMNWIHPTATPLCLHRHVVGWPLHLRWR